MISTFVLMAAIGLQGPVVKVGDRDVPVVWPEDRARFSGSSRIELEGSTFYFSSDGTLHGPILGDGSNASYREAFAKSSLERAEPWRVRIQLVTATDILDWGTALRTRRGYLEKRDIDTIYSALAQFAAMATAECGGRFSFTFDIETDSEPQFQMRSAQQRPFDSAWLRDYLWPRFNGHDFQADDKVYRGPYDSVFVVHGGLTNQKFQAVLHGTQAHTIPYYRAGAHFGQNELARDFLAAWNADLAFGAKASGYPIPEGWSGENARDSGAIGPAAYLRPSVMADRAQYKANYNLSPSIEGVPGKGLDAVSLRKLGILKPSELSQIAGKSVSLRLIPGGVAIEPTGSTAATLDGTILDTESAAYVESDGPRDLLFVRPGCALAYAKLLPDSYAVKVHGFVLVGTRCLAVLSLLDTEAKSEAQLLGRSISTGAAVKAPEPPDVLFDGSLERAKVFGNFTAKAAGDQGIEVSSGFGSRLGGVVLFESNEAIDFGAKPFLKLRWKSANSEPLTLTIRDAHGAITASFQFFGSLPAEGDAAPYPDPSIYGSFSDEWQEAVLRVPAGVVGRVVALESDARTAIWGGQASGTASISIAGLSASKTGPEVAPPTADPAVPGPDSPVPDLRARWAFAADASDASQQARLLGLLADRSDLVKLNAAHALGKVKDPKIEVALATAMATLDPRVAEQCARGLVAQGTESAMTAVSRQVMSAASEWSKLFVIRAIAEKRDVRLAGLLSGVYASRSYQVRAEGARALGMMAGREPALLVSVFLQETSPVVRLAATRHANAELDTVCRKVLFSAVNDPLDAVRIASYQKLLESSYDAFRAEGLKGIRDDSVFVRLALLEAWASNPGEHLRPAIRLGIADSDPRVRAAALLALAKLPGTVTPDEIGPAALDDDPRVAEAMAILKQAKGLDE